MTAATRLAKLRARRESAGLKRVEVWTHPDDAADVKAYAAELAQARQVPNAATRAAMAELVARKGEPYAPSSSDSDGRGGGMTRAG